MPFKPIPDDDLESWKRRPVIRVPGLVPCGCCVVILHRGKVHEYWHEGGYLEEPDGLSAELPKLYKRWSAAERRRLELEEMCGEGYQPQIWLWHPEAVDMEQDLGSKYAAFRRQVPGSPQQ